MKRRIWITKKKKEITQTDRAVAEVNNCSEIANGIPPALEGVIQEFNLPCVCEEPEPSSSKPPRNLETEIDHLKGWAKTKGYAEKVVAIE